MNILTLEHVNYSYDGIKDVLKDITLSFETGKVYGIFGKSGAGKSTLLSIMAGLERYQTGSIKYRGKELKAWNYDNYRGNEIGIIFQSYNLLPHLNALENIILSMNISRKKETNQKEKAIQLLKKVGIDEEQAKRPILQLSGGEQQRVSIARALSYDAELLFADEPTGNLDKDTEEDILNIFSDLAHKEGKCVIIISHSHRVKELADIVYELKNGKVE